MLTGISSRLNFVLYPYDILLGNIYIIYNVVYQRKLIRAHVDSRNDAATTPWLFKTETLIQPRSQPKDKEIGWNHSFCYVVMKVFVAVATNGREANKKHNEPAQCKQHRGE
jgi:hypothetical protein